MKKGKFITFEGPDGSGKTTVSKMVCARLEQMGIPVRYSREPGGSRIAEKIRDIILDPENTDMDARCEALLYAASRRQHLVEIVLPSLAEGTHVICDRFVDSSAAYQGYGRQIGVDEVLEMNRFATGGMMPDRTIFLDVPASLGLERIRLNARETDRMDSESMEFHQKVYEGYQKVAEKAGSRMVRIDASRSLDEVTEDALAAVLELIHG